MNEERWLRLTVEVSSGKLWKLGNGRVVEGGLEGFVCYVALGLDGALLLEGCKSDLLEFGGVAFHGGNRCAVVCSAGFAAGEVAENAPVGVVLPVAPFAFGRANVKP